MDERKVIAAYQARIGRKGGLKSSPAKRVSARAAAMKRWGHEPVLRVEDLSDGKWYRGKGRNSNIGLWDAPSRCFRVVAVTEKIDPLRFPDPGVRSVRLKRERHFDEGGTFRPRGELD